MISKNKLGIVFFFVEMSETDSQSFGNQNSVKQSCFACFGERKKIVRDK